MTRTAPGWMVAVLIAGGAAVVAASPLFGWSVGHARISQAALALLPGEDLAYVGPERTAIEEIYCKFPDENWPYFGQWGGGTGDPKAPRTPDKRREWEISYYCGWDPVLRIGTAYGHAPPASCDGAGALFARAVAELKQNRREDGLRILGAMLHYVQDSGSFPHVQPIHRTLDVKHSLVGSMAGYRPKQLDQDPEKARKAVVERVGKVVLWTEQRMAPLWDNAEIPFAEAKQLASRETMSARVVEVWGRTCREKPDLAQAIKEECAGECVRACADVLHTALALAPPAAADPPFVRGNLVFNPSFETDDGSGSPDGWCVGYLDLTDPIGRAERYRAGTHWGKHTHQGSYSALILRPPVKGLEWRPTWRRAALVAPGATYRASAWVKTRAAPGSTYLALEFYDSAYRPAGCTKSPLADADQDWRSLTAEAVVPDGARWLRVVLHSEGHRGVVWFDDVQLEHVDADRS